MIGRAPLIGLVMACNPPDVVPEVRCDTAEPVEVVGACDLGDGSCDLPVLPLEARIVIDRDRSGRGILHAVPSSVGPLFFVGLDLRFPAEVDVAFAPYTFDLVDSIGPVTVVERAGFSPLPIQPGGWATAWGNTSAMAVEDGVVVDLVVSDWFHETTVLREPVTLRTYPEDL